MGALLVLSTLALFSADFGICTNSNQEYYPTAVYGSNQYQVFWTDYRYSPIYSLFGARVSVSGTVIDINGKSLFQDSVFNPRAAFDGTNTMVVWREGC